MQHLSLQRDHPRPGTPSPTVPPKEAMGAGTAHPSFPPFVTQSLRYRQCLSECASPT